MFNTYEHNGMFPVVLIVWDVSTTSHSTVGRDWTPRIGVLCMGQLAIPTVCPLLPTVHCDGMDTWDWGTVHGTAWDSHSVSITSHGTVGWDGHLGFGVLCMGQLGIPTVCPLLPMVQWDGMDTWDWGTVHGTAWDSHSVSITSHGTVG